MLLPEGACVGIGGSLRVTFLPTNKVEIFEQVSKALPPFLFLSVSLSLLKLSSKIFKKIKMLQRSVGQGYSALSVITASCSATGLAPRTATLLAIAAAASCNPLPASPQQRAATLCRPHHSSELQRSVGFAATLRCQEVQCSAATCHRSNGG